MENSLLAAAVALTLVDLALHLAVLALAAWYWAGKELPKRQESRDRPADGDGEDRGAESQSLMDRGFENIMRFTVKGTAGRKEPWDENSSGDL